MSDILEISKINNTFFICLQNSLFGALIEVVVEIKVDEHTTLRFSILSSNQILIVSIDVSQESLTEVMII